MATFSANLSMLFQEFPFEQRFEQASASGFDYVECLFPYSLPIETLQQTLEKHQLEFSLFNAPAGEWEQGERGFAAIAEYQERFQQSIAKALDYAVGLECRKVHVMAGSLPEGSELSFSDEIFIDNIRYAADLFAEHQIDVLIEPLNRRDNPHYYLCDFHKAVALIEQINRNNVKLQFDIYHAQIVHGDVTKLYERYMNYVGHIQTASVPHRNEPNSGELNDNYLFSLIDNNRYQGQIGCEYRPASTTQAGLAWLNHYNNTQK
ncbi:TPA: 2-oxo-tetronate isomerase [Vibrio cholerae]|uniref:2-oxo-tetronate isomerase n=1 Tax=Gammaproteobacteria TaxID=1236 RepID=UPI001C9BF425|nr:2-oxo-tetronate isomerase [Vibrio fluvialis]EKF9172876.1 hydroxypyruvate isomerase family protein [Vibrio cholerae]MBY7771320.1 hydroxypyruvate isomerase family protein [Vibrio fluvialis]MBY7817327.1 hydroxypyruvate isomerase family protein [Vibrio fluvialis]MBY8089613.1 hydroxypyruvate isomerase family protein [Vibrio fluvialis]MBY8095869.1 hydroxypyruvate isomerase family protein [Vibrio fluvialis]